MPWVLNNVVPSDVYTDAATLNCPLSVGVNIYVENAAIYVKIRPEQDERGEYYEPELFLRIGRHYYARVLNAIAVRNAIPFLPAKVTIEAVKAYEV